MNNHRGKFGYELALVTGASSGIGAAVARKLAAEGMRVVLVARRRERLEQLAEEIRAGGGRADFFEADLTRAVERQAVIDYVNTLGDLDVLINNAGFGWQGWFDEMGWELADEMLSINIDAGVHLTTAFIPGMINRRKGYVIFIGSIAGDLPNRGVGMYSGTKAFLNALTVGLYRELRRSGVHVSIVKPGSVKSEFFEVGKSKHAGSKIPAEKLAVPVEQVVKAVWSLLRRPRRSIYVPRYLVIVQWFALLFGWIIDFVGPVMMPPRNRAL